MLHITNGESVSIPQTGLPGQVVYWNDALHDGPVPPGLSLQELSRIRERFIAEFFAVPLVEVSFARRDEAITNFRDHEEVILWFEHDLYDQLQLIQILDWFSRQHLATTRIALISVDAYLGPMTPEQLVPLFKTRHTVTAAEFETAQAAWTAFCSPEPNGLVQLLGSDTSALPFLNRALLRHLQQFPALRNGLSRAERQILELAESGVHKPRDLYHSAVVRLLPLAARGQELRVRDGERTDGDSGWTTEQKWTSGGVWLSTSHGWVEMAISLDSLYQNHVDSVACRFPNGFADFCLYRQHMCAVTHSHKRTSKWMTINLAPDLNETASTKKLY